MQAAPIDRPSSALVVREALRRAAGPARPAAAPAEAPARRRWPLPLALALAVLFGLAVAAVVLSRAATPTEVPAGEALEADVVAARAAAASIEAQLDARVLRQSAEGAVDRLLSAEHASPGRPEWPVFHARLVAALISEGHRALSAHRQ